MRIAPIGFAVAVAAVTLWRWPRLGWPLRGLGVALCGALVVYGAELIHLPNRIIETGGSEHPLLAVGTFFLAIAGLVLMRLIVRLIGSLWIRRDNPRISPSESH